MGEDAPPVDKHAVDVYDGDDEGLHAGDALISGSVDDVRDAVEVIDPDGQYVEELWDDGHIHGQSPTVTARVPESQAADIERQLLDVGWIREPTSNRLRQPLTCA